MPNKDVQNAEEQRSYCEEYVTQANEYIDYVKQVSPELAENLSSFVDSAAKVVDAAANVEVNGTTVGELVTGPVGGFVSDVASGEDMTEAAIDNFAGDTIDEFLENHGNYGGELLDISYRQVIPIIPGLNATVRFSASAEASIESKREGATVTCTGSASAGTSVSLGAMAGFELPVIGGVNITAEVEGGLNFSSGISISLGASGTTLTGTVSPFEIDLTFDVDLLVGVNPVPEAALDWVADQLGKSTRRGCIVWPLGSIALLVVRTPSYSASFNLARGKFSCSSEGEYRATLHPSLIAAVRSVKNTASNIGSAVWDSITNVAGEVYDGVCDAAEATADAIVDSAETVGRAVSESAEYVAERTREAYNAVEEVVDYAGEVVEEMGEAAQEAYESTVETVTEVYNEGREFVGEVADNIEAGVTYAADYIQEAGNDAIDYVADTASDAVDYVADRASATIDYAADTANAMIDGAASSLSSAVNWLTGRR